MSEVTEPVKLPRWATDGGSQVVEPSEGKKDTGWNPDERPPAQYFNWLLTVAYSWFNYLSLRLLATVGLAADTKLTIASGVITPTQGNHTVENQGGGSTDDLTNIVTTNLDEGRLLILRTYNGATTTVIKNRAGGAGQIALYDGNDFIMKDDVVMLTLKRVGVDWFEVCRTFNFSSSSGMSIFSSSGSFTVPASGRWSSDKWGAGGGGGGGGGSGDNSVDGHDGGDGGDGGDTIVDGKTARGGNAGLGGKKGLKNAFGTGPGGNAGARGAGFNPVIASDGIQFGSPHSTVSAQDGQDSTGGGSSSGGDGGAVILNANGFQFELIGGVGASQVVGQPGTASIDGTGNGGTGGGGGGAAAGQVGGGGGGGGQGSCGERAKHNHTGTPGATVTVTIGAPGTAGAAPAAGGGGGRIGAAGRAGGKGIAILEW